MPEYMHVGNKLLIGKGLKARQSMGPIVASRDAFYALIGIGDLGLTFGPLGALVESVVRKQTQPMETDLSEFPAEITRHPDWPIKRKKGRILVIPRDAIKTITYSFWTTYNLETDEQVYRVELKWLTRKRVLQFLRDAGWDW